MLARARFGDDAGLSHSLGKQDLSQAVIDLVRARMIQFVTLEVYFCTVEMFGQPGCKVQRTGAAHVMFEQIR